MLTPRMQLVVDNALEVIDEYHKKINKFERAILLKPQIKTVRSRMFPFFLLRDLLN
jgi:hypothetical protein